MAIRTSTECQIITYSTVETLALEAPKNLSELRIHID